MPTMETQIPIALLLHTAFKLNTVYSRSLRTYLL